MTAWMPQRGGLKGNKKHMACGLLARLRCKRARAVVLALAALGIGLAAVVWQEELARLLRPGSSGAGAISTTGGGQPASFAWAPAGPSSSSSLGAQSPLLATHVQTRTGLGGGVKGQPEEEEDRAAAVGMHDRLERAGGDDDDGEELTMEELEEADEELVEEEGLEISEEEVVVEEIVADVVIVEAEEEEEEAEYEADPGQDDDDEGFFAEPGVDEEVEPEPEPEEADEEHEQEPEPEQPLATTGLDEEPPAPPAPMEEELAAQALAECKAEYGERHFLPVGKEALPPILYSFPGSGNTWTRLLIDFATGVPTGSIFKPKYDAPQLPGQGHCHQRVSVVKAHPNNFRPAELLTVGTTGNVARCRNAGRIEGFERFVLLTRDPFDAIWSEYRRSTNAVLMTKDTFDRKAFVEKALQFAKMYVQMVEDFNGLRRTLPKTDLFNLSYETWLNEETRLSVLGRLVDFIGLNGEDSPQERRRRLKCAFILAEEASGGRRGTAQIKTIEDPEAVMTAEDAYPPEVACRMWEILRPVAMALGYGLPNGITEGECRRVLQAARVA